MKKLLLLTFALVSGILVHAQEEDPIQNLGAPSFPAGAILGFQTNEINSPKSYQQLRMSLQNTFLDSNNQLVIPDQYAIEFNPYMISKRRNFDLKRYVSPSWGEQFIQNSTVSLAATNSFLVNDTVKTNALSIGTRLVFLNGKLTQDFEEKFEAQLEMIRDNKELKNKLYSCFETAKDSISKADFTLDSLSAMLSKYDLPVNKAEFNEILGYMDSVTQDNLQEKFNDAWNKMVNYETHAAEMSTMVDQAQNKRYGWRMELNGAVSLSFPTNDFEYSMVPRSGLWLNLSYTPKQLLGRKQNTSSLQASDFELLGIVRYLWSNDDFINTYQPVDSTIFEMGNFFDVGVRLNYSKDKFSMGLEYIYRQQRDKEMYTLITGEQKEFNVLKDDYKLVLNVNYQVTDAIVLNYSLGKNYNSFGRSGNLISTFAINFGLGQLTKEGISKLGE